MADPTPWIIMPVLGAPELTEAAIADCLAQTVQAKLLIINQGVDREFRRRLEAIAEEYADRILLWSHDPCLPSLSATWNTALRFVWTCGGEEALVVNNDVRLSPSTYEYLRLVAHQTMALFVSAVGVTAVQFQETEMPSGAQFVELAQTGAIGGPDFSCFLITEACHWKYPFDEGFVPAYCEDLDLHRRMMLGGDGERIFSINLPFHHVGGGSGTLKSFSAEQRAAHEARIGQSRAHYARKWGGPVNQETYTIPFDARTAQTGVTTPELQAKLREPWPTEPLAVMRAEEA